ncbi:hypothetical protein HCU40_00580 [Pseudanabaena biceps]|nr:hypothetical protein [Pseudanabaena biceps]
MKFNIFVLSFPIVLGFTLCTVIAILSNPHIFTSFFSNSPAKLFYDIEHYSNLVIHPTCNAFYPLWPWLISKLERPQTVNDAAFYFRIIGSLLSLISIPQFILLLKQNIKSYKIIFLIVILYVVNPLSVFRMIGYTEGIFSVLSLIFLFLISNLKITSKISIKQLLILVSIFILAFLLSLTRPFLIQVIFSSILALSSILLINKFKNSDNLKNYFKTYGITTLIICLGALVGYCAYGYSCLQSRGDFFAPFHDQKSWGKQLGIYPQLFLIPLTSADFTAIYLPAIALILSWLICISISIRKMIFIAPKIWQWILLFAYPPAFLAFYGADFKKANFSDKSNDLQVLNLTQSANKISTSYIFWFCIYFALIHSIIIVFSDQKLTSLRRFIFGTPYFFVAIAYISNCFPTRKVSQLLILLIVVSSIWLVKYWLDYANNVWIG